MPNSHPGKAAQDAVPEHGRGNLYAGHSSVRAVFFLTVANVRFLPAD
ncbi:hypothetical protein AtDm6_0357 [Acetobacter tropicalis]|uniref:Uncharacterized protein n=1 Tax=Acetobacter tropicalis TaxID=104102 RepID=A0A095BBA0_9PROT|nr:hypothetical protein AtDm6_0357 [Acetobacter tropicalis]